MKRLLNYGLVASLMVAFVFAGCKKDDDDQNTETQNILPKKVSKIVDNASERSKYIYYFDENGRLIKDESFYKGELEDSDTYQYTENSIQYGTVTCSVENGRITNLVSVDSDNEKMTAKFNYSADGYLTSYLYTDEYKGKTYSSEIKYTYENGNIVEIENKDEDGSYIVKYSYGETLNNLNVDLIFLYEDIMPFSGYLGKRTKNLPSSMVGTSVGDEESEEVSTSTFSYIYDGEYLTKIEETHGNKKRTYEIFY